MAIVTIKIARADGLPGFACYLSGTVKSEGKTSIDLSPNQALVLLDIEAIFDDNSVIQEDGNPIPTRTIKERKRELVEHLMHEFGHVLEDYLDLEFSEEDMERIVTSYESKFS